TGRRSALLDSLSRGRPRSLRRAPPRRDGFHPRVSLSLDGRARDDARLVAVSGAVLGSGADPLRRVWSGYTSRSMEALDEPRPVRPAPPRGPAGGRRRRSGAAWRTPH